MDYHWVATEYLLDTNRASGHWRATKAELSLAGSGDRMPAAAANQGKFADRVMQQATSIGFLTIFF